MRSWRSRRITAPAYDRNDRVCTSLLESLTNPAHLYSTGVTWTCAQHRDAAPGPALRRFGVLRSRLRGGAGARARGGGLRRGVQAHAGRRGEPGRGGIPAGCPDRAVVPARRRPARTAHGRPLLSAEPDLDLTWLRCTPGFQSPVTVSLTGVHEREFITYQEEADPLEWPVDRPSVGATHVSMQRDLPDWVARLRAAGHGGLRRRGLGLQRPVVRRGAASARPDRRLRAQRPRSHALHPDRRRVRGRPRARSLRRTGGGHPGCARGHRLRAVHRTADRGAVGEA